MSELRTSSLHDQRHISASLYLMAILPFVLVLPGNIASITSKRLPNPTNNYNESIAKSATDFSSVVTNILKQDVRNDLQCSYLPLNLIVITACNSWQFDMLILQRAGLKLFSRQPSSSPDSINTLTSYDNCLLKRIITVCLDNACMELCAGHQIDGCVRFRLNSVLTSSAANSTTSFASIKPSPFRSSDYNYVTYLKWEFIASALSIGAKTIFSLDVDVLLLNDPFKLKEIRDLLNANHILHQSEYGDGCLTRVNSGVMILKDSLVNVVKEMLNKKHVMLTGKRLEQGLLQTALDDSKFNVTRCALPRRIFTGHCDQVHVDDVLITDVITYHAHCNKNQFHKIALLTHFLHRVMAARSMFYPRKMTFKEGELETIKDDKGSIKL